ncbi:MAG: PIG-L family deacetylase [Gemmatimonadales bacterium]
MVRPGVGLGVMLLGLSLPGSLVAQGQAVGASTGGIAALHQAERMLGRNKRVLVIAAHPDDEDTELLTVLVRGEGAEAAYLSLSRGEGGQNLIGPELGEDLGLLRTEELLAARALDGARQYFTRAFDFGYSKTIEETERFWPRDSVLKDVVRIVRRFRPQIIVAIFSGTPRDGHGHHQYSAVMAHEAFRVAGDPGRFPELQTREGLAPWNPLKFYRSARFNAGDATVALQGGVLDPDVGQSYRQIAMRSRSLHRSQDMGMLQEPGPSEVSLTLVEDRTETAGRTAGRRGGRVEFWQGIDTTAVDLIRSGIEAEDQRRHATEAAAIRAGLVFDATAADGRLVPGQRVRVRLLAWNAGVRPAGVEMELLAPAGWKAGACPFPRVSVAPGTVASCEVEVEVAVGAEPSTPYFLRVGTRDSALGPATPALYAWTGNSAEWGEPFEPAPLRARFRFVPEGTAGQGRSPAPASFALMREVGYRYRDQATGEVRRPVFVVPRVSVALTPGTVVWPTARSEPHRFTVTLEHGAADSTTGRVELELPPGWPAVEPEPFVLTREEERHVVTFSVPLPGRPGEGRWPIRAVAVDRQGRRYGTGLVRVEYPHIRPRPRVRDAAGEIRLASLELPAVSRVGYVRGAADRVPEALAAIGLPVELLDAEALRQGDLTRYEAIVVGSRAYEVEPALRESNARLLEYARAGGRLVVQYQQDMFFRGSFLPAPLALAPRHDRVTDEQAPVEVLEPAHQVLTRPNRLRASDWDGWVQERGLYFARSWDSSYLPLLAMADPGEVPLKGGLLVRPLGRGTYLYTGLAFFRQLPAGVPGAFRLFLNLLEPR